MMKSSPILVALAAGFVLASSASAQRAKAQTKVVPRDSRPPAGMCRVWIEGVPADRQPAPTDCASALRSRPAKGQVLFGDDYAHADSAKRSSDSPLKGVAPMPKGMDVKPADSTRAPHKIDDVRRKGEGRRGDRRDTSSVVNPDDGSA